MRLTAAVIQQLLDQNEGFVKKTTNAQKNFTEYRTYTISGGQLHIRASGKTSWADSRYDRTDPATLEQTRYFLNKYLHLLNTDGLW
ncbi:hypothetical protein [Streptomyces sp. NPDC002619]|uniref:hypothetical protein n=1 Tax=Streptomyces sp. NPDC002619 TaxID=3364655 RepID=UPI0036CB3003